MTAHYFLPANNVKNAKATVNVGIFGIDGRAAVNDLHMKLVESGHEAGGHVCGVIHIDIQKEQVTTFDTVNIRNGFHGDVCSFVDDRKNDSSGEFTRFYNKIKREWLHNAFDLADGRDLYVMTWAQDRVGFHTVWSTKPF